MKQLPHFALERVYLENGYTEEESDYGPLTLVNEIGRASCRERV